MEPQTGKDLFNIDRILSRKGKAKGSERGEYLEYFAQKMGWTVKRVAYKLTGVLTEDLYAFKQACDAYEKSGKPFGKAFNGMLKPKQTET